MAPILDLGAVQTRIDHPSHPAVHFPPMSLSELQRMHLAFPQMGRVVVHFLVSSMTNPL